MRYRIFSCQNEKLNWKPFVMIMIVNGWHRDKTNHVACVTSDSSSPGPGYPPVFVVRPKTA